jgi:hypothetical protein
MILDPMLFAGAENTDTNHPSLDSLYLERVWHITGFSYCSSSTRNKLESITWQGISRNWK